MRFVYFEILKSDGTLASRLIPSDKIAIIRPLNSAEEAFAEKMRSGYFTEEMLAAKADLGTRPGDPQAEAKRELRILQQCGATITHPDVRSVLLATDESKYCLSKSVEELAALVPDLIVLTGSLPFGPTRPNRVGAEPRPDEPVR